MIRMKKSVIPVLYASIAVLFVGAIIAIESSVSNTLLEEEKDDYDYVSETIFDKDIPVVNVEETMKRPFLDADVKIIKNYYNYEAEASEQENAIIQYEDTYLQNTGIVYGGKDSFDVVAVLDGEVTDVKEDQLLGTIVEIKHTPDIISIYQSLSNITVKKGDIVSQGQMIGKSGPSNIEPDLGNHLLFELIVKGQTVNPEDYYEKKVSEI